MATSDFQIFAGGLGANTLTSAEYAALTTLLANGFQAGTASSEQFNTLFRQCSAIAAMIAKFTADGSGNNSVDDGTISTLETNFGLAVTGRLINIQSFAGAAGTYTYTPTPGTKSIVVSCQGGGGGGGGSAATTTGQASVAAGGAGGGFSQARLTTGFTPTVTVTIGAGGAGGAASTVGGAGGTTSFGSILSSTGGGGPAGGASPYPGTSTANSAPGSGKAAEILSR